MKKALSLFTLLFIFFVSTFAQSDSDRIEAEQKCREAIKLMDSGKIDESIVLLEEAIKLDPENAMYPYEMGYAYYLKGDYKTAIKYLKKLEKHKDQSPIHYQLLGNAYDMAGNQKKAFEAYDKGLKLDPNLGLLYFSKGIVNLRLNNLQEALNSFEQGIDKDPAFPSNYYWAAKIFCQDTEEKVWGMIYGEIFMNLERNSKRTQEISKLLYDTYKNQITFNGDSARVSFSKMNQIYLDTSKGNDIEALAKSLKPPYGMFIYESTLVLSIIGNNEINLNALNAIRTKFADIYASKHAEEYPNILFAYHKQLEDAGMFEAYNYWLLMQGNPNEFEKWVNENSDKWKDFESWFPIYYLHPDAENRFHRSQY